MKSKRHNGMRRRNGCTPAAEPLETRRMLTTVPMPVGGFDPYFLENGGGTPQWEVQNRSGTSNGLPTGGNRSGTTGGLGISDASYAGHIRVFDFGHSIWVNNSVFLPSGGAVNAKGQAEATGFDDAAGVTHLTRLLAGPSLMSGLGVSVEYYAAQHSPTLRTLARFDNDGDTAVSADVTFLYNLASDSSTRIVGSSTDDLSFTAGDRWVITDDVPPGLDDIPAVTAVLRGPGASAQAPASVSNVVFNFNGTEGVLATYHITVPAHDSRSLMFFTQLNLTAADGLAGAHAFDEAPTVTRTPFWDDMLAGVDDAQYRQILNWASNTPPVANADGHADAYVTDEDTPLEVAAPGVLGNDTDADGDAISAVLESGPAHGKLNLRPDGSFNYTPDLNHFGTGAAADSFTYRAVDPFGALSEPATVTIDVNPVNDAPVAAAGADAAADEGTVVFFAGSGSDVDDAAGSLSYYWDFGDNSPQADGASATHAYADDGTYTAVLTVTDPSGATGTDKLTVTVANVAPVATITGAPGGGITEGTPVNLTAHVEDPGIADTHTYQWTVSRGRTAVAGGTAPGFAFTPADEGEYVVTLTVTDDDGGVGADTGTVVVANAAPTLDGLSLSPATLDENGTTHLTGGVADAGAGDVLTLSVDWADGSAPTVVALAPGASFDLSHAYLDDRAGAAADTYAVLVNLTDGDGGATTASPAVAVNNAVPVVGAVSGPSAGTPGQALGYAASFTDAGTLDTHTATVDWGDDSGPAPAALTEPGGGNPGGVSASHAYATPGVYTVTFTVRDDDGGECSSSAAVSVVAVSVQAVELRDDPTYSGKRSLYVLGTAGNDTVQVSPSSQPGAVEVVLNGVNYGAFAPTGRIIVYAGAGDDSFQAAGAVSFCTWVYGEDGNDSLNLGNGGGIASGGAGNDQINGGSGRDILLGGEGADRIVSNPGDDILISAVTRYDDRFAAGHEAAWRAIYSEWASTVRTFRQRVDNLRCGTGTTTRANGSYFLNDSTVDDDLAVDTIGSQDVLTGASGEDWFIYKAGEDKVSSMSSAEATEDLLIT